MHVRLQFWAQEYGALTRFAERALAGCNLPVDMAEDVVQEAWLRFARTISAKREEVWIPELRITIVHLVMDIGRKKTNQRGLRVEIDGLSSDLIPLSVSSHEAEVMQGLLAEQVAAKLLQKLSANEREALRLRVVEEMSAEEIGIQLGVSSRQARRYIVSAIATLRKLLP